MNTIDIERTRRQAERVAELAEEIAEDAETIGSSGFDASESPQIQEKQQKLIAELAQAVADFNELTSRGEYVATGSPSYTVNNGDFWIRYFDDSEEVVVEYSGDVTINEGDMTLYRNDSELSIPDGAVNPGDRITYDAKNVPKGSTFAVSVVSQKDMSTAHKLKKWDSFDGISETPELSSTGVTLPEHSLTKDERVITKSITL